MELPDLLAYLGKMRGRQKKAQTVSSDDIERAVDSTPRATLLSVR